MKGLYRAALPAMVMLFTGCASMGAGTLSEILGSLGGMALGDQVHGIVLAVDTRRQEIAIDADNRQDNRLAYDSRTQVTYRNQSFPITSLVRGDRISARVQRRDRGELLATHILVESSERGGGAGEQGEFVRLDGQVGWIDTQSGRFELRVNQRSYTVSLPYNPTSSMQDRFRRLRSGDRVRIEGEQLGNTRVELRRFL